MTKPVIMWFRQDLRLSDHPALTAAAAAGPVIPVFILDDEGPGDWRWGGASRWWLHKSLEALGRTVPLVLRKGRTETVLEELLAETGAVALYFSRDHAPWSGAMEMRVKSLCERRAVAGHRFGGIMLHEPESIRNSSNEYFKVYTPFARACNAKGEPRTAKPPAKVSWLADAAKSDVLSDWALHPTYPDWASGLDINWQPGEMAAQKRLFSFLEEGLKGYADGRDRADQHFTSRLSPHLHWGEISPFQVWQATRKRMAESAGALDRDGEKFLSELLWREFAYHLLHHAPTFPDSPFRSEFAEFPWRHDPAALERWQRGETGYPIVDAGMRELWSTGFMHNRVRMITASFLVKDLLIPWQLGARWFWDTLVDADIASNSASWQWVAGCGADAAPYFRVFNPVLQGAKFDPDGSYVRRWLPELNDVPADFIHKPWTMALPPRGYPAPMLDHDKARRRALAAYKHMRTGHSP